MQKVREAERERQYDEYKDRIGDISNGVVKRVEYGNVVVDMGRAEAVVRRDETLPRETYRYGDRIRAYIYDVRREQRGPQIFLSRTRPEFMAKLFAQEVPEIYDGVVELKSVARDPGSRAKIAVVSKDCSIDPGRRLRRHARLARAGRGERIAGRKDRHHPVVAATRRPSSSTRWRPLKWRKSCSTKTLNVLKLLSPMTSFRLAIGRRGQNVRLASQLTGWDIDILTEAEESERRQKEFNERSNTFMEALDVDEVIAQLLASEGFTRSRKSPMSTRMKSPPSKASTRRRPRKSRPGPWNISSAGKTSSIRSARSWVSRTS